MRRPILCLCLCAALLGCETDESWEASNAAAGLDIHLPDGASLALDVPTANLERPTSRAGQLARQPAVAVFNGGAERAQARVVQDDPHYQTRRYHIAWLRVSVAGADGERHVSTFHKAAEGEHYWARPDERVVPANGAVPVP